MEEKRCNLCNNRKSLEVYKDKNLRVVICENCSLVYLNPGLTEEENKKYYEDEYQIKRHLIYDFYQATTRLSRKESYQNKKSQLDFFKEYLNKNSQVLEIGSGWGTLLKRINDEVRCHITGIEMSKLGSQVADEYYGLKIYNQSFEDYLSDGHKEKFNFIIMHHVLEHFLNPKVMLKEIKKIVKDNGYLYMAMPNIFAPDEPLDRYFRTVHINYFSPLTILNLLKKVGLKIVKFDTRITEMRMIVVKDEHSALAVNTDSWVNDYSKKNILKIIKRQEKKYKGLRFFKKITKKILPDKIFQKIKKIVIIILRKIKIIKI